MINREWISFWSILVIVLPASPSLGANEPSVATTAQVASQSTESGASVNSALGVTFIDGSTSSVLIERNGKKYLVDLATRTVKEADPPPAAAMVAQPAPNQTPPQQQQATKTEAPARPKVYEPGDDYVFSLPTGRRLEQHGFYVNFQHRFAFEPAFSGPARGAELFGLDAFSLSSFGLRYGVTDKFFVSAYRSPTFIARPIQLMAGYNFLDEHDGQPFNASFRFSVEGRDNFRRQFTENFEGVFSRSLTSRAQIYVVPTLSLNNRRLVQASSFRSSGIPDVPGFNSFALGIAGSVDIRRTLALIAEVDPTLVGGRDLGIHRPAYAFGIQKKLWRHAFTFGFSTSPGTTVSQRSGTRAAYLGDPTADTPGGLFVGFDLTRQIY